MTKAVDFNVQGVDIPSTSFDDWQLAALAQILIELRKLNSLLHCGNFVDIPRKLDAINRNTTKRKRKAVPK